MDPMIGKIMAQLKLRQLARTRDDVIAAAVRLVELLKKRIKLRPLAHTPYDPGAKP